jgi:hypothetical protein
MARISGEKTAASTMAPATSTTLFAGAYRPAGATGALLPTAAARTSAVPEPHGQRQRNSPPGHQSRRTSYVALRSRPDGVAGAAFAPSRPPPIFGVLPRLPAASTRSSLLPRLNDRPLSRAGDRCDVEYFRRRRLRSRTGSTFQEVNGCMLWKLTSATRFPSP